MRLNIGAGIDRKEGFIGVDRLPGSDIVLDIECHPWPWDDDSVDEIVAEHLVEHLSDFAAFMNDCHRVLKPGATLTITTPHPLYEWAWQDPTHTGHYYTANTFRIYCMGHPKTTHTGIMPWSQVETTERIFRTNEVQGCEIKAVLTK